ncbi:MAG: hypothetical protein U0796_22285 [Gemmatales bacterium]
MNVRNTFFAASLSTLAVASALQADEPQPVPPPQQPAPQIQSIQPPNVRPSRRERRQGTWQIVQTTPATNPTATQPAPQQKPAAPAQQQAQAAPAINKPPTSIQSPPLVEQRRPGPLSRLLNRRASSTSIPPTVIQQPAGSQPLPTAK